jgi:hypothetical protein
MTTPDTLLIFDYSGTLSLEAPRFARPENLLPALAESGLAALGVTGPEIFWEGIVNPTWVEGSTTQAGYKRVMAERIAALRLAPGASLKEIAAAASRFVDRYLDHSRIDPRWRPLLVRLSDNRNINVIIATDHYAEATGRIVAELRAWDIPAAKIGTTSVCSPGLGPVDALSPTATAEQERAFPRSGRHPFLIANSADVGCWKVDTGFWESLKAILCQDTVKRLLVVDDFGFNEAAGDAYGGEVAKIAGRREQTRATLREVFRVEAEIIPFFLEEGQKERTVDHTHLIAQTALRIDRFLEQQ